jgi:hypothetical protein
LTTEVSGVPAIGWNCGTPSKAGVKLGPLLRGTVAVCGIVFAIAACSACGVPATDGSTAPASDCDGMRAKSAGSALAATKVHGPLRAGARNQRPASST